MKGERPKFATVAIFLMIGSGLGTLVAGVALLYLGVNLIGALVAWMLGFVYAYGGRALYKDEAWGWGAGVFGGVLYLVFGLFLHVLLIPFMAIAVVVIVLLLPVRGHFGMVRVDPTEDMRKAGQLRSSRMANPDGLHCPRCGAITLWIAADGSAFCDTCKAGIISIRPPA